MQVVKYYGLRIAVCLLTALVVLAASGAAPANARRDGVSGCRRDPIVRLSNGAVVQMTAVIEAPLSEVEMIRYTLHAPVGTSVEQVIYTGGHRHPIESFHFYADAPAGHYWSETIVSTAVDDTEVEAITRIGPHRGSATGVSEQPLIVDLDT